MSGTAAGGPGAAARLAAINAEIVDCRRCPRLVAWREAAALKPPRRFQDQQYWARPLPGFGDPQARVMIVGLAPAAHGGNRTGRIFTGDRSGDFLFEALHATGFANQPRSVSANDGLAVSGLYIAAVNRCCPPQNRPTPAERDNCLPYLMRELAAMEQLVVLLCLGAFAWDGALRAVFRSSGSKRSAAPRFAHGAEHRLERYTLLGAFHPSQQNTFTGRLTQPMLRAVLLRARGLANLS